MEGAAGVANNTYNARLFSSRAAAVSSATRSSFSFSSRQQACPGRAYNKALLLGGRPLRPHTHMAASVAPSSAGMSSSSSSSLPMRMEEEMENLDQIQKFSATLAEEEDSSLHLSSDLECVAQAQPATEFQQAVMANAAAAPNETDEEEESLERMDDIFMVRTASEAIRVVRMLRGDKLRNRYQACDVEVSGLDISKETPVGHGLMTCFSIYAGPDADFDGRGASCLWVDTLCEEKDRIMEAFKCYFADKSIKKVYHNYGFDRHVLERHGLACTGFGGDTIHMARLSDTSRGMKGGYSLEALSKDMVHKNKNAAKTSMKQLFGVKKLKKDGTEGKTIILPDVSDIQTNEDSSVRLKWVRYSVTDTKATWELREELEKRLRMMDASDDIDPSIKDLFVIEEKMGGEEDGREVTVSCRHPETLWDVYREWLVPFGQLLTDLEQVGMLVDRNHLRQSQGVAEEEIAKHADRFRAWASSICATATHMNVGSTAQIQQLLYGGTFYNEKKGERLPAVREFTAPNDGSYLGSSGKPTKNMPFELQGCGVELPVYTLTGTGWPSVNGASLRTLGGRDGEAAEKLEAMDAAGVDSLDDGDDKGGVDKKYGLAYRAFGGGRAGLEACAAIDSLCEMQKNETLLGTFILPLQEDWMRGQHGRVHCSLNINTETGRLSARRPNLQNQPALEKDKYRIRQAFTSEEGKQLIVADYGQLELRILAHITKCKSMLEAFETGGDFHSRTALGMYDHVKEAVEKGECLLEYDGEDGEQSPVPLLKDMFSAERRKAKILNFSIAYGKTVYGLAHDFQVSKEEAQETVDRWYADRPEVRSWQEVQEHKAATRGYVTTILGRRRHLPDARSSDRKRRSHGMRAAINTPIQGSAADIAMLAMLELANSERLKEMGWRLLMQVHDEVILEGPSESAEEALALVRWRMEHPFRGTNPLTVELAVDAKTAKTWYQAK